MVIKIIIGVVIVAALSAWVFYIDNKSDKTPDNSDNADNTEKTETN